jgi:LmbE family N-acetylglucosaminyl deacetylase
MNRILLVLSVWGIVSCNPSRTDYESYQRLQDKSVPAWASDSNNRTALFIFPHPDDEIVCAGTIAHLKRLGWTVDLVTLTRGAENEKVLRSNEWNAAVKSLDIDQAELLDLPNNSWANVMNDSIVFWYDYPDSVQRMIYRSIMRYRPSVLFTYDTAFGGYGHPEHRMTAKAAVAVVQQMSSSPEFPVERIFQITLPEKLEQGMLGHAASYQHAQLVTGNKTLPDPTVAVDISTTWPEKRKAAMCYGSQAETLSKFFLLPAEADTTPHFAAFSREYYYEVKRIKDGKPSIQ